MKLSWGRLFKAKKTARAKSLKQWCPWPKGHQEGKNVEIGEVRENEGLSHVASCRSHKNVRFC